MGLNAFLQTANITDEVTNIKGEMLIFFFHAEVPITTIITVHPVFLAVTL